MQRLVFQLNASKGDKLMKLLRQLKNARLWLEYGGELALLRLQMLKIDLAEQAGSWVKIAIAAAAVMLCLLVAFLSLLFGLNAYLPPPAKWRVFFGLTLILLFIALGLVAFIIYAWRNQSHATDETLQLIAQDFRQIRKQIQGDNQS